MDCGICVMGYWEVQPRLVDISCRLVICPLICLVETQEIFNRLMSKILSVTGRVPGKYFKESFTITQHFGDRVPVLHFYNI